MIMEKDKRLDTPPGNKRGTAVREKILNTADELFYREGIRAIGVDTIVEKSGVAKTSLYRWFPTKDDLIAAFLERRNVEFWEQWDKVAAKHPDNAREELLAHLQWISRYVASPDYRGLAFLIAATEFPDADHPSIAICLANKQELRRRLLGIVRRTKIAHPTELADQLLMLIDGAFVNPQIFGKPGPSKHLVKAGQRLVGA